MQCGIQVGYLLKRSCSENATKLCGTCRKPVCDSHLSSAAQSGFLCLGCAMASATASQQGSSAESLSANTPAKGTNSGPEDFIPPVYAASRFHSSRHRTDSSSHSSSSSSLDNDSDFDEAEYSAFNAVSDFDKDLESSDLYDS